MNAHTAQVHVTKLAAAQRQLRAAIRLFFLEEDELAVHTVASAAYRLIADLKAERGMNEAADYYLMSIFYVVRDYRRGTLPKYIKENADTMAWVAAIAKQLPIGPDSKIDEIAGKVDDQVAAQFWRDRNKAANFLKHADRDPGDHLNVDTVDNFLLLMQALGAYTDLKKHDLGAEGLVLWLYSHAEHRNIDTLPEEFRAMGARIAAVPSKARRSTCFALIRELNRESARD